MNNVTKRLRIIFAGTPDFAARYLDDLVSSGHQIVGVFTRPDCPAGRGKKIIANRVKALANEKGIPVFQPISLFSQENQYLIANMNADIIVVVAYSLILPKTVLEIPKFGCINVHYSLLPRWRGAAPTQRAIWAGDSETGVTIIKMDVGLDTGDVLYKLACPITTKDTSATLHARLTNLGLQGLRKTIHHLVTSSVMPKAQNEHLVTYAKKLSKEESKIDWSLSAIQLERCIRAFNPWPMSWFMINGHFIKIWKASVIHIQSYVEPGTIIKASKNGIQVATVDGILNLEMLQPAGKKVMNVLDLLNSHRKWFVIGTRIT